MLVGLIGKKRSGKDTFARRLVESNGFRRVAFADSLKAVALGVDPIIHGATKLCSVERLSDVVHARGWEAAKEEPEVRRFLQSLGHSMRTHVDPEVWLNAALPLIDMSPQPVVVTDVRYPNEARAITDRGGVLVRIIRPGQADGDTHVTETALDDYEHDYAVVNDGEISDLHAKADALVRLLNMAN